MNIFENSSSIIFLGDDEYSHRFQSERLKFITTSFWQRKVSEFFLEMKQQVAAGDIKALTEFLRNERTSVLDTFKSKGCYFLWSKCYNIERDSINAGNFIRCLITISPNNEIDPNDLYDVFTYVCLTENIDRILTHVISLEKSQQTSSITNILLNQIVLDKGDIVINKVVDKVDESFDEEDEILTNLIFRDKLFCSNHSLHLIRNEIGNSIDLKDFNCVFDKKGRKKINPKIQGEWYYIEKAILESGIAKRFSVTDFLVQMFMWFPMAFDEDKTKTKPQRDELFRNIAKSISHEKSLWKINKKEEVKIEDMWARFSSLHLDKGKVEYVQSIAATLLFGLKKIKTDLEKENIK